MSDLKGLAEFDQQRSTMNKLVKWIRTHESAFDECLDLLNACAKALRDKRVTTLERNEIIQKAEALIRALRNAPEQDQVTTQIIINGKPYHTEEPRLDYADILVLMGLPVPTILTMTYHNKEGQQGLVVPGRSIPVSATLVINAVRTDSA